MVATNRTVRGYLSRLNTCESIKECALLEKKTDEAAREALKISGAFFVSKTMKRALYLRACSLAYRSGKIQPSTEADPCLLSKLMNKAKAWKKDLSDEDREQIRQLALYPVYAALLIEDSLQMERFFKWALRNKLNVGIFVEFPHLSSKLYRAMHKPLGAFQGKHLHFVNDGKAKDILLDIEGKPVSILDGKKELQFSNGLLMTVDEVIAHLANKYWDEGYLCFFDEGVCNWNANALSPVGPDKKPVNPLDLNKERWWEQLRMKAHYTKEEAIKEFGLKLDGHNFGFSLVAKRRTDKLNTFGSHAFFRVLIPDGKGEYDYTFGWGKFAGEYPQNVKELATKYLGAPQLAVVQYPDCNDANPDREEKAIHYLVSSVKGKALLEDIKQDIILSRLGLLVFQILVHNCTDWVHQKIKRFVEDPAAHTIFQMPLNALELAGPFGWIMKLSRKLPAKVNSVFFRVMAVLIGGHRKLMTRKNGRLKEISVRAKPPFERYFQHPGMVWRH